MSAAAYLLDRVVAIGCFVAGEGLLCGLLWLIDVRGLFIAFAALIVFAAFAAALSWDFLRRRRYYARLAGIFDNLNEKTLLAEIAGPAPFLDAEILGEILRQSDKYFNDELAARERENRDYRDFLDTWVHEIKIPITSARLIVENDKSITTLRIDDELRRIERLVELVLYYARSSDVEKDFVVTQVSLEELVSAALKNYAKAIIRAHGSVQMQGLEKIVRADSKSVVFVIGQILANAIKYRAGDLRLEFFAREEAEAVVLEIRDHGIGIAAEDLPRVFDKGFTGANGRRFPQATGIGLYLCKTLCARMNMRILIASEIARGTVVTLYFPKESLVNGAGL